MAIRQYHLKPLRAGVQIYAERLAVAGIARRKSAAIRFVKGSEHRLELEPEPSNPHDRNAVRVVGCSRGLFRHRRTFLGYVPRGAARIVAEGAFEVEPRLLKTYLGDKGFVEVEFQLIGPKHRAAEFKAAFGTSDR